MEIKLRWTPVLTAWLFVFMVVCASVRAQNPNPPALKDDSAGVAASPPSVAQADRLYREGKPGEAEQEYERVVKAEPRSVFAYTGLVHVYLRMAKPVEAYAAAAKAMEIDPDLEAAHIAMGEAYFRQGKLTEAENEFANLVQKRTKEARAYLGLSRVYRAASYYRRRKLAIDRAYQLDPGDPDIIGQWTYSQSLVDHTSAQPYPRRLCAPVNPPDSFQVPLEQFLSSRGPVQRYGLQVGVNGVTSRLLVDTGASGILIDRNIAEKAGIKRVKDRELGGLGDRGTRSGYVGYADSIKVGNLEFHDCYVEVIDKSPLEGEQGLVGTDLFSRYLVDLDFPHRKLRLTDLPPRPSEAPEAQSALGAASVFHDRYIAPEMKTFTPVLRFYHYLLIPTRVDKLLQSSS
ncbi:MAG TPA: aspartyl protease family protein [Blastocatellia bacterium]|nr:aspartyl protease family protein [Blastocatellia bacterium]